MIKIAFETTYENRGLGELRKDLEYTRDAIASIQSDFEAINAGIEDGRWLENLTRDAQTALKMALGTSWDGLWDDSTKTLSTTLGDSMVDGFKNGFDNSSAIWDKGFDQLAQVGDKTLSKLISGLSDKLLNFLGSIAWDNLLKPLGSDLGLDKGLGGIVGTLTSAASSVGGTVASWLGIAPAGAGDALLSRRPPASCLACIT